MNVRPEYDFKVIGSNLKALRIKKHLTVEQVRRYMQLGSAQAIYKWERGDGLPQADSLIALLELYGVDNFRTITEGDACASPSLCLASLSFCLSASLSFRLSLILKHCLNLFLSAFSISNVHSEFISFS